MLNRISISIGLLVILAPGAAISGDESALLSKSRALTAKYATELQTALKGAMATGGPVAAIDVCKDKAPAIAARLSEESGAIVSRTSLRNRNPDNVPDDWERPVLSGFSAGGEEHYGSTDAGEYRYMKAIPTGAVCLACHGETLAPEIAQRLDAAYPDDKARGYKIGDIRGAFSITWPAEE